MDTRDKSEEYIDILSRFNVATFAILRTWSEFELKKAVSFILLKNKEKRASNHG